MTPGESRRLAVNSARSSWVRAHPAEISLSPFERDGPSTHGFASGARIARPSPPAVLMVRRVR